MHLKTVLFFFFYLQYQTTIFAAKGRNIFVAAHFFILIAEQDLNDLSDQLKKGRKHPTLSLKTH
jgi:hypothetical protein